MSASNVGMLANSGGSVLQDLNSATISAGTAEKDTKVST